MFTSDELNKAVDLVLHVPFGPFNKTEFESFLSQTVQAQVFISSYTENRVQSSGTAEYMLCGSPMKWFLESSCL